MLPLHDRSVPSASDATDPPIVAVDGFEILNVGTGVNYNMLEIVEMIGGKYRFIPNRLGEAKETLADISKIKQMINWSPKIMI